MKKKADYYKTTNSMIGKIDMVPNKVDKDKKQKQADEEVINLRVAYQKAIDLWIFEGELIWNRFNFIIAANGALIVAAGVSTQAIIYIFISLLGATLAILGIFLSSRSYVYHDYFLFSARDFEEKLGLDFLIRGREDNLFDKEKEEFTGFNSTTQKDLRIPISWWSRSVKARKVAGAVNVAFLIGFIGLIFIRLCLDKQFCIVSKVIICLCKFIIYITGC
ncbi:MAG: hypothetical protein C4562_06240 [Actinobacteria bacterium]|nr:MAG: hypothetical protein C4562_06240 [Actinomycetota bacterium]